MSDGAAVRAAVEAGRYNEALDTARDAFAIDAGDEEIAYWQSLAHARLGAWATAAQLLESLISRPSLHTELRSRALALEGRLLKDRAWRATDVAVRRACLLQSCARYEMAGSIHPSAYFAVNAASMYRVAGDHANCERMAREALRLVNAGGAPRDHWDEATLGEASLLLGDAAGASRHYASARQLAGHRFGDLAAMRRQLRLLAHVEPAVASLLHAVPAPTSISFTGHMLDRSDRRSPRFPASLEDAVRGQIERRLDAIGPAVSYSQAACGSDLIFVEAMQARGNETHIVLPCATHDFLETSVRFAGSQWEARFEAALRGATSVRHATAEGFLGDDVLFLHAAKLIHGLALVRARQLDGHSLMLAIVDRSAQGGIGGSADTLARWAEGGHESQVVDLAAIRGEPSVTIAPPGAAHPAPVPPSTSRRSICAMVFADVRGYSKLPEHHSPRFAERFLTIAKESLDEVEGLRSVATAGDGVFAVFGSPRAAATFAISLRDRVGAVRWSEYAMPDDTHVRVGVHCGPVYGLDDPVTGRPNHCGTHVNMTARIEPVAAPGAIFATESIVAYLALDAPGEFDCEYLGVLPLAKGFGEAALYRVERGGFLED